VVRAIAAAGLLAATGLWVSGCAASRPGSGATRIELLRERVNRRWANPPRLVLAFYYAWYATKECSGSSQHWGPVDRQRRWIRDSLHYPLGGPYDSTDPQLVDRHMRLFRRAGIDAPIVSWWGPGHHSDKAMPVILEKAARYNRKVTVYLERVADPPTARSLADDLIYLARKYARHPAFLKLDGRPVIFIYGRVLYQLPEPQIVEALAISRRTCGVDWVAISDLPDRLRALLFDGLHTYAPMASYFGRPRAEWPRIAERDYGRIVRLARRNGRIAVLTVFPGYDDRKIRKPGLFVERADGALYDLVWEKAIQAGPDWIVITSFNELHEGSEIEPTAELGDRYVQATARWSAAFRLSPREGPVIERTPVGRVGREDLVRLLRRLGPGRIGVFGGVNPEVMRLAALSNRVDLLTAEELLSAQTTPAAYPVLVYAGGETFPSNIQTADDVPDKLAAYLAGGGRLLVMANGPFPFFYDRPGHVVRAGERFGLFLRGIRPATATAAADEGRIFGFERPPAGVVLRFHAAPAMGNLPKTWAFPDAGDLRWRPAVPPPNLAEPNRYTSLVRLEDEQGKAYGDAVALYEYRQGPLAGGRILYVWFRLGDTVATDDLLYDVLHALLEGP